MSIPARTTTTTSLFIFILFFGAYMYSRCIDSNILASSSRSNEGNLTSKHSSLIIPKKKKHKKLELLNCSIGNPMINNTCSSANNNNYPVETHNQLVDHSSSSSSTTVCPDYFRWIHEDLQPWMNTGITMEMVRRAESTANFRIVIVKGKVYMETYRKSYQTRDIFTLWGVLQLLRKYPGKLPDLDLMFDAGDKPVIKSREYQGKINAMAPPPVFHYCGRDSFVAIVFPDWSFWGWPEIRVKPWGTLLEELKEGNRRTNWMERDPYAYWKGNPKVATTRQDLLKCNVSDKQDWNARLYAMDWGRENRQGFRESNLANQCNHRYKIYIEGGGWSVSEKYILACDSLTLLVKPLYYDFFTRSLVPMQHYWPIQENDDKCRSIKFAVDWGNNHTQKAQDIGKAASNFIQEDLRMNYVYDYMFHVLNEYAKLLRYKPTIPQNAVEFCSENMACPAVGLKKRFMMESMVKAPSDTDPCTLPPLDPHHHLEAWSSENEDSIKEVETRENKFWNNQNH